MDTNKVQIARSKYDTVGNMLNAIASLMAHSTKHIETGIGRFDLVDCDNGDRMYKVIESSALPLGRCYTCMELIHEIKVVLQKMSNKEFGEKGFIAIRSVKDLDNQLDIEYPDNDELIYKSKSSTIQSFFDLVRASNKLEIMVHNFAAIAVVWGLDCDMLEKSMRCLMRDMSIKVDNYKSLVKISEIDFDAADNEDETSDDGQEVK